MDLLYVGAGGCATTKRRRGERDLIARLVVVVAGLSAKVDTLFQASLGHFARSASCGDKVAMDARPHGQRQPSCWSEVEVDDVGAPEHHGSLWNRLQRFMCELASGAPPTYGHLRTVLRQLVVGSFGIQQPEEA